MSSDRGYRDILAHIAKELCSVGFFCYWGPWKKPAPTQSEFRGGRASRRRISPSAGNVDCAFPPTIARAGRKAQEGFLEFFFATIRNENTRQAYARAIRDFFAWCEERGLELERIASTPLIISGYIEKHPGSTPTVKQHLAALRMLFDYLVKKQVVPSNPATVVRGPRQTTREGKTPILTPAQVRELIEAIKLDTISGVRDRAMIGAFIYTWGRVSAVVSMKVKDYFPTGNTSILRLHEKNGKVIDVPAHHNLQDWLDEYVARAEIRNQSEAPLFRAIDQRRNLTGRPIHRNDALAMIKRRAKKAGLSPHLVCCHSMRGTGITTYLENGGSLEYAQYMAGHADVRTTKLYDRRQQRITKDEVERIHYW